MEALSKDMLYAILSGAFVLFYTFAHSGSLLVSAIGPAPSRQFPAKFCRLSLSMALGWASSP